MASEMVKGLENSKSFPLPLWQQEIGIGLFSIWYFREGFGFSIHHWPSDSLLEEGELVLTSAQNFIPKLFSARVILDKPIIFSPSLPVIPTFATHRPFTVSMRRYCPFESRQLPRLGAPNGSSMAMALTGIVGGDKQSWVYTQHDLYDGRIDERFCRSGCLGMYWPYVLPEIILVIPSQSAGFKRQGKVIVVHQPCLMFRRPASLLTRNFQNTYPPQHVPPWQLNIYISKDPRVGRVSPSCVLVRCFTRIHYWSTCHPRCPRREPHRVRSLYLDFPINFACMMYISGMFLTVYAPPHLDLSDHGHFWLGVLGPYLSVSLDLFFIGLNGHDAWNIRAKRFLSHRAAVN